jgi:hypothetical protein
MGEITNFQSVDAEDVSCCIDEIHFLWALPLQVISKTFSLLFLIIFSMYDHALEFARSFISCWSDFIDHIAANSLFVE